MRIRVHCQTCLHFLETVGHYFLSAKLVCSIGQAYHCNHCSYCQPDLLHLKASYDKNSKHYSADYHRTGVTAHHDHSCHNQYRNVDVHHLFPERLCQEFKIPVFCQSFCQLEMFSLSSALDVRPVLVDCPCQIHDHRDLHYLEHVQLESKHLKGSPCLVDFFCIYESQIRM